jgi:hypothetical protein
MPSIADLIWNRACYGGGADPREGDVALAALLLVHGRVMNGGVLHGVECSESQLRAAKAGYCYFGFTGVAELLARAEQLVRSDVELGEHERQLDQEYAKHIPSDSTLVKRFEEHYVRNPLAFLPVH